MAKVSRNKLIKKLDKAFSRFIRLRNCDEHGRASCFTCGVEKHWKEVDAGHFQTRAKFSTRWNEKNVQFQCKRCNMTNGGQQYEFGLKLDEVYGAGTADEIVRISNQTFIKHTSQELIEMTNHYNKLASELEELH